jgi:hypothetical protein
MRNNLGIFGPRQTAERNPVITPELMAALWRLQPSGAPQQISELIRRGYVADALAIVEAAIAEAD